MGSLSAPHDAPAGRQLVDVGAEDLRHEEVAVGEGRVTVGVGDVVGDVVLAAAGSADPDLKVKSALRKTGSGSSWRRPR